MTVGDAERERLAEDARRAKNWKRWGTYLAERQWGTVREDYSADGASWDYLPHDHARSRAYRWGEDGLLGWTDRECRLCFALALWNERDPILKERLFGLSGPEGNHGEDVKEYYFYLDAVPTYAYAKALYKYPQAEFPYAALVEENRRRGRRDPEYELIDTGVFEGGRYFDVFVEYAKAAPDDVLIRVTVANRGPDAAPLHVLPTLWFRNTWAWGRSGEGYWPRPLLRRAGDALVEATHATLGRFRFAVAPGPGGAPPLLFTENETNVARLFGARNGTEYVKDAFHTAVVGGDAAAVNPAGTGTKAAAHHRLLVPAGTAVTLDLRLSAEGDAPAEPFGPAFEGVLADRRAEAERFHATLVPAGLAPDAQRVQRQAFAGLLWSKQFYHYAVREWLEGDPAQPPAPAARRTGRNHQWGHLYNRDVISIPDSWEYPWYAAWDLAFHTIPFATLDPAFAKEQLVLFLREWYMHPNGQLPAYEFALGDVNPPVHAWACWQVYKRDGARDRPFLARVFQKLLLTFTWWVNRKDLEGDNLFSGGFLGLDNVGLFDRSQPLPSGVVLEQADGTGWMAFYCTTMLKIALELAREEPIYEDMASKFFEHFVAIADAMNEFGGTGLWDDADGFYYDQLRVGGALTPLRVRSAVGLVPLFAGVVLEDWQLDRFPDFRKRAAWFVRNRTDLAWQLSSMGAVRGRYLLAIPTRERLERVLRRLLDEDEFLSPFGVRSLSRVHRDRPFLMHLGEQTLTVAYEPGESESGLFGGNSNWRGPVWFPINFLVIEALRRFHHFYGGGMRVECPTGSGRLLDLGEIAAEIEARLARLFVADARGRRACHGEEARYVDDPHWRDLVLFHEYFHGDTGRGCGASHQTGWTALIADCLAGGTLGRA
ncbi:MAG TPA: glucosidase [Candidatus Binatia bacterium]|nr:glucosidase [Candidatus Binatia bacterium]